MNISIFPRFVSGGSRLLTLACLSVGGLLAISSIPANAEATLPANAHMQLFLLTGQSNMSGRGKVGPQDKIPNPHVWMLTKAGTWVPAVDPMHFDKPHIDGVGPGRTFGIAVAKADPSVEVGLVPCAFGGTSIEQWHKGGKLYDDAIERAKIAEKHGTFKAILWHQGESDANPRKEKSYPAKLKKLIAEFRADLNAPNLPFVAGQLGRFHQKHAPGTNLFNEQLVEMEKTEPHYTCVSSKGLTDKGYGTHFNAESQREFGRRYAAAYFKLIGKDTDSQK